MHGAIHIRVAARFPHQTSTQIIVVLAKVTSLFEYRSTFNRRQTIYDDAQRLTTSVHVDGSNRASTVQAGANRRVWLDLCDPCYICG